MIIFISKRRFISFLGIILFGLQKKYLYVSTQSTGIRNYNDFGNFGIIDRTYQIMVPDGVTEQVLLNMQGLSLKLEGPMVFFEGSLQLVYLVHNKFDLYDEQGTMIEADRCSVEYFQNRNPQYFSRFEKLVVVVDMRKNFSKRPMCPYVFKNANILHLMLMNYEKDQLFHSTFTLYDVVNPANQPIFLETTFGQISFANLYNHHFETGSLSPLVFSSVKNLRFQGAFYTFATEFFKDFNHLTSITLLLYNSQAFFHSSYNEWFLHVFTQGLNYGSRESMAAHLSDPKENDLHFLIFQIIPMLSGNTYFYPEEDFCLFQFFPRFKAIFTQLWMNDSILTHNLNSKSVSCT